MKKTLLFVVFTFLVTVMLGFQNLKEPSLMQGFLHPNATVQPTNMPDAPGSENIPVPIEPDDTDIIVQTIKKSFEVELNAAITFDMTEFPTVFINDPRFPVGEGTLQFIRDVTQNSSLENAGYLDYKLAYYTWRREGALRLEAIQKKMQEEGRSKITEEEASLLIVAGRPAAPRLRLEYVDKATLEFSVKDLGIDFENGTATVVVDRGSSVSKMFLIKANEHWYIAGIEILGVYP